MVSNPQNRRKTDRRSRWYSVSVDTLRGVAFFLLAVVLVAGGVYAYRLWKYNYLEEEAAAVLAQNSTLFERYRTNEEVQNLYSSEYEQARQSYQQARRDFAELDYRATLRRAHHSLDLLLSIDSALKTRADEGEARFHTVQGEVEYRRADSSGWQRAKAGVVLRSGDFVRTGGSGSAQIMFRDLSFFTVRPNTQVVVSHSDRGGGGEQGMQMVYGWVNLSTSKEPSKVTTPRAEAEVQEDSEAFVTYEQESETGRFGAYRGSLQVSSADGTRRRVSELEQVVQEGDALSENRQLPVQPELIEPPDNFEVNADRTDEVVLAWRAVGEAERYALQVSESHLFVDNIVDVEDRTKTQATLGIRGEGSFLWRVAAVAPDGSQGPWSVARRLRIGSTSGGSTTDDKKPPDVELLGITSYGSIFIINGRTEPGSKVSVNDEPVKVDADGSFTKTIQLGRDGWNMIDVRAQDAWGNERALSRPVFVESP